MGPKNSSKSKATTSQPKHAGEYSGLWLPVVIALVALIWELLQIYSGYHGHTEQLSSDAQLLRTLREMVAGATPSTPDKVAVGTNACLDLVANSTLVIEKAGLKPHDGQKRAACKMVIETEEDFVDCFAYHFAKGAAGERFVADPVLFRRIVDAATQVPGIHYHIGGNAAIMATKLVGLGSNVRVLLGSEAGPKLRELLPERVFVPEEGQVSTDEVHLILEYRTGDTWGPFKAPRANRFIVTHDVSNQQLKSLGFFASSLLTYEPDLVVISGMHMLEGLDRSAQTELIEKVRATLVKLPPSVAIHLELASFGDETLLALVAEKLLPCVDSLGLNEQEVSAVSAALGGPIKEYEPVAVPDSGVILDALDWLVNKFCGPDSRLTRVHFHSLAYHITVVPADSPWGSTAISTAAAALAAPLAACDDQDITAAGVETVLSDTYSLSANDKAQESVTIDPKWPIHKWMRGAFQFSLCPVLVCKKPVRTVGLGDTISATGLKYSAFKRKAAAS